MAATDPDQNDMGQLDVDPEKMMQNAPDASDFDY